MWKTGDVVQIGKCVRRLVRPLPNDPGGWEVDRPFRGIKNFHATEFGVPEKVACVNCGASVLKQSASRTRQQFYCGDCAAVL